MLEESPSMQAVIRRSDKGPMQRFLQKIGEPRVLAWIAVATVLILWAIVVAAAQLNPIDLPRPTQILIALAAMFNSGGLLTDLPATLGRIFGGFAISLIVWTLLGMWMATSERVNALAD